MIVYLDVIWILNFLFDSLLLYLTTIMLKRRIKLWRIFLGGFIGSLIIPLSFTSYSSLVGNPLIKLCFSIAMVLATFGLIRLQFFIKSLMFLYLSTFLIGGTLIGVHYFIKFNNQLSSELLISSVKGFGDPVSWIFVMIGFPLAWHFSNKGLESIEMTKIQYDQLVDVELTLHETKISVRGLIDSGNQLYDPITRTPVMIVSIMHLKEGLPIELIQMAENPETYILGDKEIPVKWENKIKIIPCRVVGQDHKIIMAFKPDLLEIRTESGKQKIDKALVSLTMQQLSSENVFQCIVHPKMLTNHSTPTSKKVS